MCTCFITSAVAGARSRVFTCASSRGEYVEEGVTRLCRCHSLPVIVCWCGDQFGITLMSCRVWRFSLVVTVGSLMSSSAQITYVTCGLRAGLVVFYSLLIFSIHWCGFESAWINILLFANPNFITQFYICCNCSSFLYIIKHYISNYLPITW